MAKSIKDIGWWNMSKTIIEDYLEYEPDEKIKELKKAITKTANSLKGAKSAKQLNKLMKISPKAKCKFSGNSDELSYCGSRLNDLDIVCLTNTLSTLRNIRINKRILK